MTVPFEKWNGAGNDFVIVDAGEQSVEDEDARALAVRECDREQGIGADGVLLLDPDARADPARVEMTLVQPDGTTAAMCGNGVRCAAKWAADRAGTDEVVVDTPAGARRSTVRGEEVAVEMGTPSFGSPIEERVGALTVTAVDTGVPHAVAFVDDVDAVLLAEVAPPIRHHEIFPEGANVTLAAPDDEGFRQRTYERGVEGETVACGTGAVAVAAVARRRGLVETDEPVPVSPPGGTLTVTLCEDGALMEGPVEKEFAGHLEQA